MLWSTYETGLPLSEENITDNNERRFRPSVYLLNPPLPAARSLKVRSMSVQ